MHAPVEWVNEQAQHTQPNPVLKHTPTTIWRRKGKKKQNKNRTRRFLLTYPTCFVLCVGMCCVYVYEWFFLLHWNEKFCRIQAFHVFSAIKSVQAHTLPLTRYLYMLLRCYVSRRQRPKKALFSLFNSHLFCFQQTVLHYTPNHYNSNAPKKHYFALRFFLVFSSRLFRNAKLLVRVYTNSQQTYTGYIYSLVRRRKNNNFLWTQYQFPARRKVFTQSTVFFVLILNHFPHK